MLLDLRPRRVGHAHHLLVVRRVADATRALSVLAGPVVVLLERRVVQVWSNPK
ncbi:hypothetical protein C8R44DRAFT_813464, partial [Mycena epipterygia]